jgi:hypothetical protein
MKESPNLSTGFFHRHRFVLIGGIVFWVVTMATGLVLNCRFESTAGPRGATGTTWPADSGLPLARDRFTLVVGLHPLCPCSRSTVLGLEQLLAGCPGRVSVLALLFRSETSDNWDAAPLTRHLESLPDVTLITDPDGREAQRFGIATSGHVLLYRPSGKLLFSGGITRGRGLEGDNPGLEAVLERVRGSSTGLAATDVFGCPIHPSSSR